MPDSASSGWETEVSEVERQVSSVLQQAQAVGTVLHSGLQVQEQKNQEVLWNDTFYSFSVLKAALAKKIQEWKRDRCINKRTNE